MTTQVKQVNSQWCYVDSADDTTALRTLTNPGNDPAADAAKWISDNRAILDLITDAGGGVIPSAAQLAAIATNTTNISSNTTNIATNTTSVNRIKTRQTLADAATLSFDVSLGLNATFTSTASTAYTLPLLTNAAVGENAILVWHQDGVTGGATLDATAYYQPGGTDLTLSSAAGSIDVISIYVETASIMIATILKNVSLPP